MHITYSKMLIDRHEYARGHSMPLKFLNKKSLTFYLPVEIYNYIVCDEFT